MSDETFTDYSKKDFFHFELDTLLQGFNRKDPRSYANEFFAISNRAEDAKVKGLSLVLGMLMTPQLDLDSSDTPYNHGDRFTAEQLSFFGEIVTEISDYEIASRIADVLWLRTKNYKMAELAIKAYLNSARYLEDFKNWTQTQRRLERAVQLASSLGRKGKAYPRAIKAIKNLLNRCNGEDPLYLSAELMRLLQERGEGDVKKYARFAKKLALNAESQNDFHRARRHWETKAGWHFLEKKSEKVREARINVAECYEKESEFNLANRQPKFIMASHPIEQAIVAYRKAGDSEKKIDELKLRLRKFQSNAVRELPLISSGCVDISDIVLNTENLIAGMGFTDALKCLAFLHRPSSVGLVRKQVEQNRKKYLFATFFPKRYFSASGRGIANQPADGEEAVLADIFHYMTESYQVAAKGIIEPARRIILLEHAARVLDLRDLVENHPFIPPDREFIVARGLHAGLTGDFLTAIHFLIPQFEESIRHILIQRGVVPSSSYDTGIQDEFSLNKLLTNPKFTEMLYKLFGEDLIFEFRGVLVERFGANLRNELAHGLIDHGTFYSYAAVYFWWLALRFYLLPSSLTTAE